MPFHNEMPIFFKANISVFRFFRCVVGLWRKVLVEIVLWFYAILVIRPYFLASFPKKLGLIKKRDRSPSGSLGGQ